MNNEVLELKCAVDVADAVEKKIRTVGIKGLDFDAAREAGVFNRISNLLCVVHASIMAARRVYNGVEVMVEAIRGKRNDIAKEMNAFNKAYDRFVSFWTEYYANGTIGTEVDEEAEQLFNNIMVWSQLPYQWSLGDPQRIDAPTDTVITVENKDKIYYMKKTVLNEEVLDSSDSWCISKYSTDEHTQVCIEEDMDKASAMMVAKRLSAEDPDNIYTACQVLDVTKKETIVTPFKSYKENKTVGKETKVLK